MVMYNKNSFLAGLAVGKSLKGATSMILESDIPTVYCLDGQLDRFYIDFKHGVENIGDFEFNSSIRAFSNAGSLTITGYNHYSRTTLEVFANLNNVDYFTVVNIIDIWLQYDSGKKIPKFSASYMIKNEEIWSPGLIKEHGNIEFNEPETTEEVTITYPTGTVYIITETAEITPTLVGTETVTITYDI